MGCDASALVCELQRIADALNGWDWNNLIGTFVATVVGGLVAAAVTLWVNGRERARPHWRIVADRAEAWNIDSEGRGSFIVSATNIGDGAAYNVVLGRELSDDRSPQPVKDVMEPGDTIRMGMRAPAEGEFYFDNIANRWVDTRTTDWPTDGHSVAVIYWQEPPRRAKVRHRKVRLESPLPKK